MGVCKCTTPSESFSIHIQGPPDPEFGQSNSWAALLHQGRCQGKGFLKDFVDFSGIQLILAGFMGKCSTLGPHLADPTLLRLSAWTKLGDWLSRDFGQDVHAFDLRCNPKFVARPVFYPQYLRVAAYPAFFS